MLCTKIVLNVKTKQKQQFVYTTRSAGNLSLQFSWTMNNLLPYCGLVDAKIRASDKGLPVPCIIIECCILTRKLFTFKSIKAKYFELTKLTIKIIWEFCNLWSRIYAKIRSNVAFWKGKLLKITYLKIEYKLVSVCLHRYNELRLLRPRQRPWYRVDDVPLCLPGDEGD